MAEKHPIKTAKNAISQKVIIPFWVKIPIIKGGIEAKIIINVLRLRNIKVEEILTPRKVVFALEENLTIDEVLKDKEKVKKFIENTKADESSIRFGKSISPSIALVNLANNFDSLIITYFLGFSDLAIFKVVTLLPNQIKIFANALTPMLLPKIASQDLSKKDLMKHFKKFFLIVVFLILVYLKIHLMLFLS